MKLKKLFAGIVAVAMMATMAIPGFAAEVKAENIQADTTSAEVKVSYKLANAGTTSPKEDFEFTIAKAGTTYVAASEQPELTIGKASFAKGAATTGGATASATIDLGAKNATFTKPGIYNYFIEQTAGSTAGVTYAQSNKLLLKVTVFNKVINETTGATEIWKAYALYHLTDNSTASNWTVNGNKIEETAIENLYTANVVNVSKTIKGSMANRDQTFNFKAVFSVPESLTWTPDITFAENGITATQNAAGEWEFVLGDKQQIHFNNIPAGVTFYIAEADYTGEDDATGTKGYTTTYKYNNNDAVTAIKTDELTMNANAATVAYTNTKGGMIDTGVILDNAPYIALLTIVAAGAVVMILKKRRNYED